MCWSTGYQAGRARRPLIAALNKAREEIHSADQHFFPTKAIPVSRTRCSASSPRHTFIVRGSRGGKILLLNSYSIEDTWTAETNRGIAAALRERSHVEFLLKTSISRDVPAMHPELRELIVLGTRLRPDLIITTENDATSFARTKRRPLSRCSRRLLLPYEQIASLYYPPDKRNGDLQ